MTTQTSLSRSLTLFEVKPGLKFSEQALRDLLPDAETAFFFGKVYGLNYKQLSALLDLVLNSTVADELFRGTHSEQLQDYFVDLQDQMPAATKGKVTYNTKPPQGEILPEMWKAMEIEVAASIKAVAEKLASMVGLMPGKQAKMLFQSMQVMNAKRPTIGDYRTRIHHERQTQNLIIFDVSGSMSEPTVRAMVDDVVALSYMANAHLAIVSNTCTHWEPGSFSTQDVLDHAEYGGTQYQVLEPLMQEDWGVVVTVADYDSSMWAKDYLVANCKGHIDTLVDVSLVPQPTFLAECIGHLADEVRPMLIGSRNLTRG